MAHLIDTLENGVGGLLCEAPSRGVYGNVSGKALAAGFSRKYPRLARILHTPIVEPIGGLGYGWEFLFCDRQPLIAWVGHKTPFPQTIQGRCEAYLAQDVGSG